MLEASGSSGPRQPCSRPSRYRSRFIPAGPIGETSVDALALLRLQIEWGADEALDAVPVDRLHPVASLAVTAAVAPRPSPAPVTRASSSRAAASGPGQVPAGGPAAAAREAAAAAMDIPSLRAVLAAFEGCGLRDTATNLVSAEGDAQAGLVIVGEVPDGEEDRTGRPFAGRPGLLLDHMLHSIGLHRSRLLLAPLIPWRPPGNRPPSDLELSICLPFLQRLLVLARPTHLVLMGSRPAKLLAGTTIRADAGWQRPTLPGLPDGARVLAMRHPAYLLSHLPARRDAWADLLRLRHAREPITGT